MEILNEVRHCAQAQNFSVAFVSASFAVEYENISYTYAVIWCLHQYVKYSSSHSESVHRKLTLISAAVLQGSKCGHSIMKYTMLWVTTA